MILPIINLIAIAVLGAMLFVMIDKYEKNYLRTGCCCYLASSFSLHDARALKFVAAI
jgi:hypothetical protein